MKAWIERIAIFIVVSTAMVFLDWGFQAFANPIVGSVFWAVLIYSLPVIDATRGLPGGILKKLLPGVKWFDCVIYAFPFVFMVGLTIWGERMGPLASIAMFPLFFVFGAYFLARMPALRRGSEISTQAILFGASRKPD